MAARDETPANPARRAVAEGLGTALLLATVIGSGIMSGANRCNSALNGRNRKNMNEKRRVLILCTGNSARSQMAEGLLRKLGGGKFAVESAGVAPSSVRPEAIEAMRKIGIDISGQRSKSVDEFAGQPFDYVMTVCDNANQSCPVFTGVATRIHQSFEDPPPESVGDYPSRLAVFRRVRDDMRDWLINFSGC